MLLRGYDRKFVRRSRLRNSAAVNAICFARKSLSHRLVRELFRFVVPFLMTTNTVKPVALISMPTLSARFPSFQLALLKPTLEREGIPVQTFPSSCTSASSSGWRINETLSDVYPCMTGEWLWTKAAFGDFANDEDYFQIYKDNLEGICRKAQCTVADLRAFANKLHRPLSSSVSTASTGAGLV